MEGRSEEESRKILTEIPALMYCQTPVQSLKSRLGVDFVFPLSQKQQQQEQQEEQPHQNIAEESILEVLNLTPLG